MLRTGEALCPKDFLRFCRAFGPLEKNEKYDPDFLLPGYPEILRLGNLRRDGKYRALFVRAEPGEVLWHTDDSFRYPQPAGSIFHCRTHPESGGGTWYAGMADACDALPSRLRRRIEGRFAVHSYTFLDDRLRQDNPHRRKMPLEVRRTHPPVIRPLVVNHPETGRRALLIPDCHIESITGLEEKETRSLLGELLAHATGPDFAVCWQWRPGDVAVWDNRSSCTPAPRSMNARSASCTGSPSPARTPTTPSDETSLARERRSSDRHRCAPAQRSRICWVTMEAATPKRRSKTL